MFDMIDNIERYKEDIKLISESVSNSQSVSKGEVASFINYLYSGYFYFVSFIFVKENINYITNFVKKIFLLFKNQTKDYFGFFKSDSESETKNEDLEHLSKTDKLIINYQEKYKDKFLILEDKEFNKEQLDQLKNKILLENTPLGNVIMFYDNNRETFTYYSDSTIPYRFLETVARKYVVLNDCKNIFVNMDEEIKVAEKKLEEKKQKKLEEDEKNNLQKDLNQPVPIRKNIFAKLKSYNKDSGLKVAGISGDYKGGAKKNITETNEKNMILKENANRYSCEGKINNFSFYDKTKFENSTLSSYFI